MSRPSPDYAKHTGQFLFGELSREKQDELIHILLSTDEHFTYWVVSNDVMHDQPYGIACIVHALRTYVAGDAEDWDEYDGEGPEALDRKKAHDRDAVLQVISGTKLWLRLEEAFPPFKSTTWLTSYDWSEVEAYDYGLDTDEDSIRCFVESLERYQHEVDGDLHRLPFSDYVKGWHTASLALFVNRVDATQLYQHAPNSWRQYLPIIFLAGLTLAIPIWLIFGLVWGVLSLAIAIAARKYLSRVAVDWVREDSLSSPQRYRLYAARGIVWARKPATTS